MPVHILHIDLTMFHQIPFAIVRPYTLICVMNRTICMHIHINLMKTPLVDTFSQNTLKSGVNDAGGHMISEKAMCRVRLIRGGKKLRTLT